MPNITGQCGLTPRLETIDGAFYTTRPIYGISNHESSGHFRRIIAFDASRSSEIYGNSSTVQPPAVRVYVWIREA